MNLRGLNAPVREPTAKDTRRAKRRLFMKKDKNKSALGNFGRKMKFNA